MKKRGRTSETIRSPRSHDKSNDFQLGIHAVRIAMDRQRGVHIRVPLSAFSGHWPGYPDMCHGVILEASPPGQVCG